MTDHMLYYLRKDIFDHFASKIGVNYENIYQIRQLSMSLDEKESNLEISKQQPELGHIKSINCIEYILIKVKEYSHIDGNPHCVSGNSQILCPNNVMKYAKDLNVGDTVISYNEQDELMETIETEIIAILETQINDETKLTKIYTNTDGLEITGYHSVKIDNEWVFPSQDNSFEEKNIHIPKLFSFALKEGHILNINNTQVIGLAHGINDNDVTKHPYFGTNLILNDIKNMDQSMHAIVTSSTKTIRDPTTNLVIKIIK